MSDDVRELAQRILAREAHSMAFSILVRAIDALPQKEAETLIDEVSAPLEAWPAQTRIVYVARERPLGLASKRLCKAVALHGLGMFPGHADFPAPELTRLLEEMPHLESLSVGANYDLQTTFVSLRAAPRSLRSFTVFDAIPTRQAETYAESLGNELERFDQLENICLNIGDATESVVRRLVRRPLARLAVHASHVSSEVLSQLEPRALQELELNAVGGGMPAWDIETMGEILARFPNLTALSVPFLDAARAARLPLLRRLDVGQMDAEALLSLPTSLIALRSGGLRADESMAAFDRCPDLAEINWVGQPLSKRGIQSLTKRGADARLSALELNGAITRDVAKALFTRAVPRRLRRLNLFGLDLRDATMATFAECPAWHEHLVELNIEHNALSDRGLAALLDVLLEKSRDLVCLQVHGNAIGDASRERLRVFADRGVVHPAAHPTAARGTSTKRPAENVASAWTRLAAFQREHGTPSLGLRPPPPSHLLERARDLPPSLHALYTGHDAMEGVATFFGFGRIVWWPLERVLEEGPDEVDGRNLVAFGHRLEDDEEPGTLDDSYDRDDIVAVDVRTEEVFWARPRKGYMGLLADDLGAALTSIADRLEAGELVINENGDIVARPAPPEPLPPAVATPSQSLATLLVERRLLDLKEGASINDLAKMIDGALAEPTPKMRVRQLISQLESDPIVDELYAEDDFLKRLLREFV